MFRSSVPHRRTGPEYESDVKRRLGKHLIAALGRVATPRERELLSLLDAGASREEAAVLLGMSRKTVDVHCSNLRQKLRAL